MFAPCLIFQVPLAALEKFRLLPWLIIQLFAPWLIFQAPRSGLRKISVAPWFLTRFWTAIFDPFPVIWGNAAFFFAQSGPKSGPNGPK